MISVGNLSILSDFMSRFSAKMFICRFHGNGFGIGMKGVLINWFWDPKTKTGHFRKIDDYAWHNFFLGLTENCKSQCFLNLF